MRRKWEDVDRLGTQIQRTLITNRDTCLNIHIPTEYRDLSIWDRATEQDCDSEQLPTTNPNICRWWYADEP